MNGKWNGIGKSGAGYRELEGNMIQSLRYTHMGKAEEGGISGDRGRERDKWGRVGDRERNGEGGGRRKEGCWERVAEG